ncbi:MAG: thiol reductase thioredoxin [Gammaproteobacteria bacterium CG11_big_fil_rev_8_21_14_0_20_46_22]|nr:MAG: thiol reductase thioredoxin [Gammaproteobacteria bacterium CG12_big_fil_rev_8_21_14_0_65_46_12]PIR11509.1 MAG: thiol reductase thioredoxin [Gammaproteobacteria bacterium CG11_big_fil_rev_8_21_14_0_20_46_22]
MSDLKAMTDAQFDAEVLNADGPVLVDFWAEWCGPCRMLTPVLEQVAGEYAGKLTIYKINVDDNSETPAKFGVRGIPTMILFKDGEAKATKVGALSKAQLTEWIDEQL